MANNGPYRKRTLLEDTINGTVREEKKEEKQKSTAKYDGLSTASNVNKFTPKKTTEKKSSTKSTAPAVFKPRTLLETTITRSNDNTKANVNNRHESRFTPRTKDVHSKRIKEIDTELQVLGASWKVLKSNGESEDKMKRYETRMAELRKEKESLVKSGVMFAQGHVKTMDSVSAVEDLKSLTRNDVERSRAAEQKREEEREKQYEQDSVKASNFWQKEKKQERDTTESLWRPEFDRSNAFAKSDNDEVVELAKDPKKLKIADGSKEAEYYVKGWGESQKDYPRDFLYLDKTSDNSTEVPLGYVITQDEYDALMYIRGKYGKDEAEKYIRTSGIWDRKIKAEGDAKYRETIIRQGRENPVASYIGTMVTAVPNAVAGYSYTSKKIANKIAGYEKHDTSSEEDWFNNNPQNLWQEGRLLSTDSELLQSIYTGADFVARNIVELSAGGTVGKVAKGLGAGTKAVKVFKQLSTSVVADKEYVFKKNNGNFVFGLPTTSVRLCILSRSEAISNLRVYDFYITKETDTTDYEPYHKPITTNLYVDKPLYSDEFVKVLNIPTFKGTTIVSADTTIQPSNVEIEYYSNIKE